MSDEAHAVFRTFAPAAGRRFQSSMHYIMYCTRGVLRLEADGRIWSLPPARAAVIRAGEPVHVTLPRHVTACSVLLARDFVPAPPEALAVIDMSSLARELIHACAAYGEGDPLHDYGRQLFRMLAHEVYRLAETPSRATMPAATSAAVARAVALTEEQMADAPTFEAIAAAVAMTPRTLARRFAGEMGMAWREVLRCLRMIRATELLLADAASVTDVALATGYRSLSAFNAAFKDFAGETPSGYRRRLRATLGTAKRDTLDDK